MLNLAKLTGGSAILKYRGASLFTQKGVQVNAGLDTFNIAVDGISDKADERPKDYQLKVTATIDGAWGNLSAIFPHLTGQLGALITPRLLIGGINTSTNVVTSTAHGLNTGDAVFIATRGTLPTLASSSLDTTVQYFIHKADADTLTMHANLSDATSGTSALDFTSAGVGDQYLIVNYQLTVQTYAGKELVFYNAAVTKMPDLEFARSKTLFSSDIEFTCYIQHGKSITDASSRYSISANAFTDIFEGVNNIPTQPYSLAWVAGGVWAGFDSKAGVKVSFPLTLTAIEDEQYGIVAHRLSDVQATAQLIAMGMDETDLLTALGVQGSGTALGRSLSAGGANLDITGTGVFCRLYGAFLKRTPMMFNVKDERSGNLEFAASKTVVSNVVQPIAFVGTSAPS